MEIKHDGAWRMNHAPVSKRWSAGKNDEDTGVLETALFAGHRVMAVVDGAGAFDLHYLGFTTGGFKTMASAKQAATEFVLSVLSIMKEEILSA